MDPKSTKSPAEATTERACNTFILALRSELQHEALAIGINEAADCMKTLHELEAEVQELKKLAGKKRAKASPKAKGKKSNSEGKGSQ
jgi:hypothetical protein